MPDQQDQSTLQALARALSPFLAEGGKSFGQVPFGRKASGSPIDDYIYQTGGLFGRADGAATLVNAMVGPIGVERIFQWFGNDTEKEFTDALTSYSETGSEQSTGCGDCKKPALKACAQVYCWGRFCRQTEELQFDQLGTRGNANIPIKTLFGSITGPDGNILVPQGSVITDDYAIQARMVGYGLRYKNSQIIWTGSPLNNINKAYQEYYGLEWIVNTGKFDAYTQIACDALDSFLLDYLHQAPTAVGDYAMPTWFNRMNTYFATRAGGAGLDWETAELYIVMHPELWDCVSAAYACSGLELCGNVAATPTVISSSDSARERYEEYRSGMYLPVGGKNRPVILDTQMTLDTGQPGGNCGDIFFLTTQINGEPILYGEYQDFNRTYGRIRNELVGLFGSDDIAITDGGRFALVRDNERGCFDIQGYTKPRLIAKMPWLSGRIQNVCCSPTGGKNLPAVSGSGSVYEKDGGRHVTSIPTLYGDCLDC